MRLPGRSVWIPAAAAFALLAFVYGGELLDAQRLRAHEVAALTQPPNALFAAGTLLFALGAAAIFLGGVARGADASFRGYRLLPIVAVLALFADLFVLPKVEPAAPVATTARAIDAFAQALVGEEGALIRDPGELQAIASRLGAPQYLVRGERLGAFQVELRPPCDGPATDARNTPAGTLLVCFDAAGDRAWVTAVALPEGVLFGAPALFTRGGAPHVGTAGGPGRLTGSNGDR